MQRNQSSKNYKKGQVKIEFSPKLITSWGGTAALFWSKATGQIIHRHHQVLEQVQSQVTERDSATKHQPVFQASTIEICRH